MEISVHTQMVINEFGACRNMQAQH